MTSPNLRHALAGHAPTGQAHFLPLSLIVATTPVSVDAAHSPHKRLGIGYKGMLPWPRIKLDMSFFARVTSRAPITPSIPIRGADGPTNPTSCINVVIMGRKTYDSIPERFRPLAGRFNVVISRDTTGSVKSRIEADWRNMKERKRVATLKKLGLQDAPGGLGQPSPERKTSAEDAFDDVPDVAVYSSLEVALQSLRSQFTSQDSLVTHGGTRGLGSVYVIGGAEIYRRTLELDREKLDIGLRIIMTDIRRDASHGDGYEEAIKEEFECDTFFPINDLETSREWKQAGSEEVSSWVGEDVQGSWQNEGDVRLRMLGFERV